MQSKLLRLNLKFYKSLAILVGLGVILFLAYRVFTGSYTVVTVNEAKFTYKDINKSYAVDKMLRKELKTGSDSEAVKVDMLYTLVVTAVQLQVLEANNIPVNKQELTDFVKKNSANKKLFRKVREYLGDDYYRLFVQPLAINQLLGNFYDTNDPRRNAANNVLNFAQQNSLSEAAQSAGVDLTEIVLNQEANKALYDGLSNIRVQQLEESAEVSLYPAPINLNDSYLVAEYVSSDESNLTIRGIRIAKQSYADFLSVVANNPAQIDIEFGGLSLYDEEDLRGIDNSIFK